jgi:hypothetical protein
MVFLFHERKEMGANVKFCDVFFDDLHHICTISTETMCTVTASWTKNSMLLVHFKLLAS